MCVCFLILVKGEQFLIEHKICIITIKINYLLIVIYINYKIHFDMKANKPFSLRILFRMK